VYKNPRYAAMIESLDASVGKIMQALRKEQLDQNTLIIFTSDNGGLAVKEGRFTPATLNSPLRNGKGFLSEGGIRVPLIMHWPGLAQKGQVTKAVVSSVDFSPTIQELVTGTNFNNQTDGVSLLPYLQKKQALPARAIYWHYPHYSNQGGRPGGAIRKENLKLLENYETQALELYDLTKDLGEQHNLAATLPHKATELSNNLNAWRQSVKAQMPVVNPAYTGPATKP
jgi:arylsulfatase A-like enzyme